MRPRDPQGLGVCLGPRPNSVRLGTSALLEEAEAQEVSLKGPG